MNLSHHFAADGYWALFALVTVESLGIPLPGLKRPPRRALTQRGAMRGHLRTRVRLPSGDRCLAALTFSRQSTWPSAAKADTSGCYAGL
jgi:hypothetical protein